MTDRLLVVLNGPIASGKSTVARVLAGIAERHGRSAAAIDLDEVWHMVDHQEPRTGDLERWLIARHAAAAVTDVFFASGVKCVVVEGPFFTDDERQGYQRWIRASVVPRFVTLDVSFDESVSRIELDPHPGRVRSRNGTWLRERYDETREMFLRLPPSELLVHTDGKSAEEVASEIWSALTCA